MTAPERVRRRLAEVVDELRDEGVTMWSEWDNGRYLICVYVRHDEQEQASDGGAGKGGAAADVRVVRAAAQRGGAEEVGPGGEPGADGDV